MVDSTEIDPKENLSSKLKRGVFWQYLQTLFITIFNFGAGIVMARLLNPSDFGVFAAVTAITNLLLLQVSFGWTSSLLRARVLEEPFLSSVFWLMQAVAVLLMGAVIAAVPMISRFYGDERFAPVMLLISLQFFIVPFNTINGGILRWKMRYDLVSRITMAVAVITSISGMVLAYIGFGVYSLVATGILSSILLTGIMAIYAPWKPKFTFSIHAVKPHFDFTWRLHLNNSLNLLANRIDNMMIGKLAGMRPLGIYVKAFSLGKMPVSLLATNLYQMFFTALSRVRENRQDSVVMFQKMIGALTFSTYLPLLMLLFLGEGFIFHLYGSKWMEVVLPMRIMIIGSFASVISVTSGAFCAAQNLVRRETKVQLINLIMTVVAVAVGSKWGITGVTIGVVFKTFIMMVLMKNVLYQGIGLTWSDLWKPVWPNICASFVASIIALALIKVLQIPGAVNDLLWMALIGSVICSGYIAMWAFLAVRLKNHEEMEPIIELFKTIFKKASYLGIK